MKLVISAPEAENDLIEILAYTQSRWGVNQRRKYNNQLKKRFLDLAKNPQRGRKSPYTSKSIRFYREGSHVIFCREIAEGIQLVRILHERMDFERHL